MGITRAVHGRRNNLIDIFVVKIELVEESWVDEERFDNRNHQAVLSKYVHQSGFNTVSEWIEEIRILNKRNLPEYGMILKVSKVQTKGFL